MKLSLLLLLGCLMTGVALAQNLSIAKDQAKRAAGTAPSGQAPSAQNPAAAQPPVVNPATAATVQNIANLRADFIAIAAAEDTSAAADQRISLLNHLSAAAQGSKASVANLRKLADDFVAALATRKKVTPDTQKLAGGVHALFNVAHLTDAQQESLLDAVTKILTTAEVPAEAAAKVVEDLKAIAAETKK